MISPLGTSLRSFFVRYPLRRSKCRGFRTVLRWYSIWLQFSLTLWRTTKKPIFQVITPILPSEMYTADPCIFDINRIFSSTKMYPFATKRFSSRKWVEGNPFRWRKLRVFSVAVATTENCAKRHFSTLLESTTLPELFKTLKLKFIKQKSRK